MLETLGQNYIQTARAKGLRETVVVYKHALKNAALPVVTTLGLQAGYMLAANVVLEMVFSRPGMGRLIVDGILRRDYPVVQGVLLILAISVMVANLLADIMYSLLDPRIKLGR
jgi:ABC-type dipeptide/oligopeptide/nickel transport system permease component